MEAVGYIPLVREDLGPVLEVEVADILGGEERSIVLIRRRKHRCHQRASARPGDHVEVVRDARVRPVQLLSNTAHVTKNQSRTTKMQL